MEWGGEGERAGECGRGEEKAAEWGGEREMEWGGEGRGRRREGEGSMEGRGSGVGKKWNERREEERTEMHLRTYCV